MEKMQRCFVTRARSRSPSGEGRCPARGKLRRRSRGVPEDRCLPPRAMRGADCQTKDRLEGGYNTKLDLAHHGASSHAPQAHLYGAAHVQS